MRDDCDRLDRHCTLQQDPPSTYMTVNGPKPFETSIVRNTGLWLISPDWKTIIFDMHGIKDDLLHGKQKE
jgi:hypothetical protein